MVAWLLKNGAMADALTVGLTHPGRTALHFAAAKRSESGPLMVKELLNWRANPATQTKQGGNTPLHYAVDGRSVDTVKALLEKGADPNVASSSGITPLHKAAAVTGLEEMVEAMIQGGAAPNQKTSVGAVSAARGLANLKASRNLWQTYYSVYNAQTALHIATKAKDAERTMEALLKHGGDANCQDSAGRTPLHVALVKMDPEAAVKLLIDSGANVNCKDVDGKTPLLVFLTAVKLQEENKPQALPDFTQSSRERVLDLLLSSGADPSAEAKDKQSPMSFAQKAQLQWAVDKLKQPSKENGDSKEAESAGSPKDTAETESSKKGFLETQASRWLPKRPKK